MSEDLSNAWNPVLKKGAYVSVVNLGSDRMIGKSNGELFSLACDVDLVETILSYLEAPLTLDELAQRLGIPRASFDPFIRTLIESGLITSVKDAEGTSEPYVDSVVIVGQRWLAEKIMHSLSLVVPFSPVYIPSADWKANHSLHFIAYESAGQLQEEFTFPSLKHALTEISRPMLVGAPTGVTVERLLDINNCCLETETPWLPLYFDGTIIRLGPTVIPYKTPCFGCLIERQALDQQILSPQFPVSSAFHRLLETWSVPERGALALDVSHILPDCVDEIVALCHGGDVPRLIGRQLLVGSANAGGRKVAPFTFDANSRCTSCHCGARRPPTPLSHSHPSRALVDLDLAGRPASYFEGGLRDIEPQEARRLISEAFARFGTTFRIERCCYGPLSHLPSYRSYASAYLDRDLSFLISDRTHTGKGTTEEQAYLSAAYEMAERVSAVYCGQIPLVQAKPADVADRAIDLSLCLGEPYLDLAGYDRIHDDGLIDWVWGQSLITGQAVLVPASLVFFPQPRFRGVFKPQWSGGLAAGATLADAVLQGLLERVEHDGWAVWQLNRVACPRVKEESIADEGVRAWIKSVRDSGFDLIIRDKRTDLDIPAFRVWIVSRETPHAFACRGDGAHLDKLIALKRALTEAQHKLAFTEARAWQEILSRPTTQLLGEERSLYFLSGMADFELADDGSPIDFDCIDGRSTGSVAQDIETTVKRIDTSIDGADVVVINLTSSSLNIPTVRVITVGLQEMAKPWIYILPRTFDLPVRLGRRKRRLAYHELYHGVFPH